MITERDALAGFKYWADRVYALETTLYAATMKADKVDIDLHLRELRRAQVAKQMAHAELQAVRGRHQPQKPVSLRRPSVKLDLVPTRRSVPKIAFAHSSLTVKSVNSERREIQGWATTPEPDHLSDIIEPRGAEFALPSSFCISTSTTSQLDMWSMRMCRMKVFKSKLRSPRSMSPGH